jgi:membrane fusion protein, multidrug efflux system
MTDHAGRKLGGRWLLIAALVLAAAGGGWFVLRDPTVAAPAPAAAPASGLPVTTGTAARRDVAVYLGGIGNVQALYAVLVRSRVDGTLDSVNFTEGQEVKKGDLLAVIDPRPFQVALEQAQAQLAHDQALLQQAETNLARYQTLLKQDSISRQQAEDQRFLVLQYHASIQTDQALIDNAKLNLTYAHIVSPLNGRVGLRMVDPGNLIHANDAGGIVTVTEVRPITAVFTLPEESLPRVTEAMRKAKVTVLAYSADHKTRLSEGELLTPDNAIDVASGTIKLKAIFSNTDGRLWPGQFIDARVQVDLLHDALTIPAAAVQHGQDGLYIYVVKPDSTVALRPVEETLEQDGTAVIAKGLEAGEQVVTNGQSRLTDGVRVLPHGANEAPKPASAG